MGDPAVQGDILPTGLEHGEDGGNIRYRSLGEDADPLARSYIVRAQLIGQTIGSSVETAVIYRLTESLMFDSDGVGRESSVMLERVMNT